MGIKKVFFIYSSGYYFLPSICHREFQTPKMFHNFSIACFCEKLFLLAISVSAEGMCIYLIFSLHAGGLR